MKSWHKSFRIFTGPLTAVCVGGICAACTATLGFPEEDADKNGSGAGAGDGSNDPDKAAPNAQVSGPAEAPLKRLTKAQYNSTIRDLLGYVGDPAESFGADEEAGGFASNYLAPVAPLQVEYYELAADELAAYAGQNLPSVTRCEDASDPGASSPGDGGDLDTCVGEFLTDFGLKAYRRPLSVEERASYVDLFDHGLGDDGDVLGAFELVIRTMLQSPHFLYRVEVGGQPDAEGGVPLSPYEIASRLSYFLQNTMPDEALLAAAAAGELATVQQIEAQARRLLSEPEAQETLATFHEEWLAMGALGRLEKNTEVYPEFTPVLREAMLSEVSDFANYVINEGDGRLETLLTAPYTFAEGPLLQLYGASAGSPGPIALPPEQRGGLFTLASVMAVHSHPDQTSPVVRGYVVSDKLLCILPPPPPPNLDIEIPSLDPNLPTRERFELHREDPSCASCHQLMDPLGFTFEHYDAIGRYRTMDGINPVDASSELSGTEEQDGPVENAVEMMKRLANADEVRRCVTRQWFRYAFGRLETEADEGTVNEAFTGFSEGDFRIVDLLVALTKTTAFRTMKSDGAN